MKSRKLKRSVLYIVGVITLLVLGFFLYVGNYYSAHKNLSEYSQLYNNTQIEDYKDYTRIAGSEATNKGFVFYPGGKVEHTAYIPLLATLAEQGYVCFLAKMPFHLAVFNMNAANDIIRNNHQITEWYIGGHSLGGAMASVYASKNSDQLRGIIFLGAYPSSDLSDTGLKMISIYGENDLIINRDKLEETRVNAPSGSFYYEMEGANHGGFGDYGPQKGDGEAEISGIEQRKETVRIIIKELGQ